jgi:uncharacterized protein (DUF1800 family)
LLRRAGFGAGIEDLAPFEEMSLPASVDYLVDYERVADDVDSKIGQSGYVGVTARGVFSPNTNIEDSRQRWLFRMVHSQRPLQEKMALFWHNHFATAYSKVAQVVGALQGARLMAGKPGQITGPPGQYELFRSRALGSFRDLLIEVAKDPAMLVWLDGRTNTRQRPQENFGREIMELFTFGLGNYTEQDVYAAARVFTGWNLRFVSGAYEFVFNAGQHDTTPKEFTFAISGDGNRTIPSRAENAGIQDGIDFITALARHPETARRLARKLWGFFVSETSAPDPAFVETVARIYLQNNTEMKPVVRYILRSPWFTDTANHYARYAWPVEYVIRALKEVGASGFSVDTARTPLTNMGQTLFEPPDVSGWSLGPEWFSTGAMLARMNFAATLATNQKFNLAGDAVSARATPERLLTFLLDRLSAPAYDSMPYNELLAYLRAGGAWTGSDAQLNVKTPGVVRLIIQSAEYQFV